MASKFPFGYLTKVELNDLFGLDLPSHLQTIPSQSIQSIVICQILSNLALHYQKKPFPCFIQILKAFQKIFDQLQNVLSATKTRFDVIGVTETKQRLDKDFLVNVNIEGYQMHTQPSQLNAGRVAIYTDEKLDHFKRDDLSKYDENFEAVWVEIKNKKGRNFLCACVYRHPNTDVTSFTQYVETVFTEMNKDNIFIMGDFNIDLLQYGTQNSTNDLLNSMISHGIYIMEDKMSTIRG